MEWQWGGFVEAHEKKSVHWEWMYRKKRRRRESRMEKKMTSKVKDREMESGNKGEESWLIKKWDSWRGQWERRQTHTWRERERGKGLRAGLLVQCRRHCHGNEWGEGAQARRRGLNRKEEIAATRRGEGGGWGLLWWEGRGGKWATSEINSCLMAGRLVYGGGVPLVCVETLCYSLIILT